MTIVALDRRTAESPRRVRHHHGAVRDDREPPREIFPDRSFTRPRGTSFVHEMQAGKSLRSFHVHAASGRRALQIDLSRTTACHSACAGDQGRDVDGFRDGERSGAGDFRPRKA